MNEPDINMNASDAAALLAKLREVPPVGAWAILDTFWCGIEREWVTSAARPDEWAHTYELAEEIAKSRPAPTWIAQVIACDGGWTLGVEIGPFSSDPAVTDAWWVKHISNGTVTPVNDQT